MGARDRVARLRKFRWSKNWYIVYRGPDGGKRLSTRTSDYSTAKQILASWEAAQRRAELNEPTIGKILDLYEADREGKVSGKDGLKYAVKTLQREFGSHRPHHIDSETVGTFIRRRNSEGRALGTCTRELRVLRAALRYAERNRIIERAPRFRIPADSPASGMFPSGYV